MAIGAGDRIPSVNFKELTSDGIRDVSSDELFAGKKTVLFAVPGAFTPLCSAQHLPGFIDHADAILAKGVDQIVCVAVNDPFVMDCWGKDRGAGDKVRLLSDGNAEFARAAGLDLDASGAGLGTRCKRFAAIVEDGTVGLINVDEKGFEGSKAETILAAL